MKRRLFIIFVVMVGVVIGAWALLSYLRKAAIDKIPDSEKYEAPFKPSE